MIFTKTQLYFSTFYLQMIQIANQEIKNVLQWLDSSKVILNVSKTNFMMFKTRKKKLTCQLESQLAKSIAKNHVVCHRPNYGKIESKKYQNVE